MTVKNCTWERKQYLISQAENARTIDSDVNYGVGLFYKPVSVRYERQTDYLTKIWFSVRFMV